RAGRQLQMSWSLARFDSKHKPQRASRFLSELGKVEESMGRAPKVEDAVALNRCRQCGRALVSQVDRPLRRSGDCTGDADLDLLIRLRRWGVRVWMEQWLPPYPVLTAASMPAIAEVRQPDLAKRS